MKSLENISPPKTEHSSAEREAAGRRGFLKRFAMGVGGLALVEAVQAPVCRSEVRYPCPEYLPPNYVLSGEYVDRTDGFLGGPTELTRFYRNEKHPEGFTYPLIIYMAERPGRANLMINNEASGISIQLHRASQVFHAEYFDGLWIGSGPSTNRQRSRQTGNVHSLTFQLGNLRTGLVGCRLTGCGKEELIHVAESLK